jgi:exopolysaccharide biosynthesis polyprenyl glycosylphosphotransferase
MHKSNKLAYSNMLQLWLDILFLLLTYIFTYEMVKIMTELFEISSYLWILIVYIPIWISIMAYSGMYNRTTFYYTDRILRNVIFASLVSGLATASIFFFIKEVNTSRLFIGFFIFYCIVFMLMERMIFSFVYRRNRANNYTPHIILVCSKDTCSLFKQYLIKTQLRYNIIGVIQVGKGEKIEKETNLGKLEELGDILKKYVVDEVIFTLPKDYVDGVRQHVRVCEQMGITAHIVMNSYDLQLSHVHISMLGPLPMLTYHTVTLNPLQKSLKRAMDIAGALIGITATMFASLIIVPAIMLDSPGPIIFKQKRVGRYGRVFDFYKFRTMCADAEAKKQELLALNEHKDGLMFKIKKDPRITRVGAVLRKTSLDELPQFFNVLKGDMSLVGTRPPTRDEVAHYDLDHWRRISIKPGLTGMWQVSGRSDILDFDEVVALDTRYIDEWSIWLDICIMLKTVTQVVRSKSAY